VGYSELEANIVPSATGTSRLLATAGADVSQAAADAGKRGIDAAMVGQQDVSTIIPSLQAEEDEGGQAGQEGEEDGEVDGLQHGDERD
jgi:hypothetical protein